MGMEIGQWVSGMSGDGVASVATRAPSTTETVCARSQPYLPLEPALHNQDFQQAGFEWIDCSDNRHSVATLFAEPRSLKISLSVCNFTPQPHSLPYWRAGAGFYTELFNSDAREYGGSNMGGKWTDEWSYKIALLD